ncbi:putative nuclease HARBI1 [Lytechinus variegatus]|uniref:putative nuclease HARBI1 n=2 Tax=Lytechinus variegatus TaxID=7654 RepID=UPI001BB1BA64|nr:putative nuclease HARBI1 [Lytechinus variegatus]
MAVFLFDLNDHMAYRNRYHNVDRLLPGEMNRSDFRKNYRLNYEEYQWLCDYIRNDEVFERRQENGRVLSVELKVAAALRFFASGSFQNVVGDVAGISQPSQSRAVAAVTDAISRKASDFINFTLEPTATIKSNFAAIAGMPNTIGCIDCTHVYIRAPRENENIYVNRKNRHSINVQGIVDSKMRFVNVVAKWPGSSHDSYIWETSNVLNDFRMGRMPPGWLLGDSGYPTQPWLMTPLTNPQSPAEQRFNSSLTRTRVCVERAFGILKSRFRCLDMTGGSLCYEPSRVCKIILSCCVLHNICIDRGIPPPNDVPHVVQQPDEDHHDRVDDMQTGQEVRRNLINTWFN